MKDYKVKSAIMIPMQGNSKISPFPHGNPEVCMEWCQIHGYNGIEPIIPQPEKADGKSLKKAAEKYGLDITTIVTGQTDPDDPLSLCSSDEAILTRTKERMMNHIKLASELRSMVTVGLIKGTGREASIHNCLEQLKQSLNELFPFAERLGVTLLLEPINHTKCSFLQTAQDVMQFIHSNFDGAPVKILWDSYQSEMEGEDVVYSLSQIKNDLGHIHFADNDRQFPGEGHIPFPDIFSELARQNYDGYVTLECYNIPNAEFILKHAEAYFKK